MLKSVTDTICDSFIILTDDKKVIVIDGGHKTETDYFIEYLQKVTGQKQPHIDAWFLSHAHDDHCEVFLEIVENRSDEVSFGSVLVNFPPVDFFNGTDEWADVILHRYYGMRDRFSDKEHILRQGEVFSIGSACFTVLYTYDPVLTSCNDSSVVFRMDLGGKGVMFTGDAEVDAGRKILSEWKDSGLLKCDYCKMAHHGQSGVDKSFYEAVSPEYCFWPTPTWVLNNTNGNLKTFETRRWVNELGVKKNYKSFTGTKVIRLP